MAVRVAGRGAVRGIRHAGILGPCFTREAQLTFGKAGAQNNVNMTKSPSEPDDLLEWVRFKVGQFVIFRDLFWKDEPEGLKRVKVSYAPYANGRKAVKQIFLGVDADRLALAQMEIARYMELWRRRNNVMLEAFPMEGR